MLVAGYVMMLELGISGVGYAWLVANGVGCVCVGVMVWREEMLAFPHWIIE